MTCWIDRTEHWRKFYELKCPVCDCGHMHFEYDNKPPQVTAMFIDVGKRHIACDVCGCVLSPQWAI